MSAGKESQGSAQLCADQSIHGSDREWEKLQGSPRPDLTAGLAKSSAAKPQRLPLPSPPANVCFWFQATRGPGWDSQWGTARKNPTFHPGSSPQLLKWARSAPNPMRSRMQGSVSPRFLSMQETAAFVFPGDHHRMALVEKNHSAHLVPTPCYVLGRQPADQAAQSHIQPGLECLQGWGIHSLLGQSVPYPSLPLLYNTLSFYAIQISHYCICLGDLNKKKFILLDKCLEVNRIRLASKRIQNV